MKTNKCDKLPPDIEAALLKVAKVLYYRFEFSRGDMEVESFGSRITIEYDNGERKWPEKKFPRTTKRDKFLAPPGSPAYLDDLKQDLLGGGKKERDFVKGIVEDTATPLCPRSSIACSSRLEPFFPAPKELKGRVLEYFRELFRVQEFLIRELKVKPGSLLPVWVIEEPSGKNPFPMLGLLPVRKSTVNALTIYLLWELGLPYLYEPVLEDRNNPEFYDNALRWARISTLRFIRESDIADRTDVQFQCFTREQKTLMRKIKDELPPELQTYPPSWAAEVLQDIDKRGETAKPTVRKFKRRKSDSLDYADEESLTSKAQKNQNSQVVQSSTFISLVNRAVHRGNELFNDYKNLW